MITALDDMSTVPATAGEFHQVIGEAPVYVSFDIDVLDPIRAG
jgi:arginase family enzyme